MACSAFATLALCAALAVTAAGTAAAASPYLLANQKPIYRVDSVGASIHGKTLTIIAAGAVSTGGWTKARLVPKSRKLEGKTLEYEFVATPPPAGDAVIQALVPVSITFVTKLPSYGVTEIKVDAETDSSTAKINR
jgi:hypothetical protein